MIARWRGRLLQVFAGLALAAPAAPSDASVPLCRARVVLDPPTAVVGQQVRYTLRILRRQDVMDVRWERNLSFPALRAEWLPGSSGGEAPGPDGESYRLFEERRALFPARTGLLEIPAASMICRGPRGEEAAEIAAATLTVVPAPEPVPDDWTGVVGEVRLRASASTTRLRLGESVRVRLVVEGAANVWDAKPRLIERLEAPELEVFTGEEDLARDAGRALTLRRYLTYDLVPRRAGRFVVPALSVTWLDPDTGRFMQARTEATPVDVEPAALTPPPADEPTEASPPRVPASRLPLGTLLLVPVAAGAAWWALRRRRPAGDAETGETQGDAMAEAQRHESAGDALAAAAALSRAVRLRLEPDVPDARNRSTEELFARVHDDAGRDLVVLLQRLDRARFTRDGSLSEVRSVREAIATLRDPHDEATP